MITSLILSLFMLCITLYVQAKLKIPYLSEKIESLLFYLLNIKILFFFIIPAIARLLGYSALDEFDISIELVSYVYILEFIYLFVWVTSFLIFYWLLGPFNYRVKIDNNFYYLLSLFSVMLFISTRYGVILLPTFVVTLFGPLSFEFIKATCLILLLYPHSKNAKLWRVVGLFGLILVILSISTRGAIFYLLILAFYFVAMWRRRYLPALTSLFIPLILFLVFSASASLPSLRINDEGSLRFDTTNLVEKRQKRSPTEEVFWRFGALTRFSTGFIEMYDRGDSGGWSPIVNSSLGFLPRSINPEKPHPSTKYGNNIYSQGMYLTVKEVTGVSTNMAEFSVGAQTYWENGILAVFGYGVVSSFFVILFLSFYSRLGALIALTMLVVLSKPFGYVEIKLWLSELILHFYSIFLPMVSLWIVYSVFRRVKGK
jgi:hypothetical protein